MNDEPIKRDHISADRVSADHISLPPHMTASLAQYRLRVWSIKLTEGALAAIFGLVVSYLAVLGLDRLFDTPALLRAMILVVGSLGMVIVLPMKWHYWIWRHRRLDQVARLLRHRSPRFGDHLMGVIELARSDRREDTSRALVEAAMRQVDEELRTRNLTDAVPSPQHRRWAWLSGIPAVCAATAIFLVPDATSNALLRWAMPWQDVERYTFTQLSGNAGRRVVPYAETFQVRAALKANSPWKPGSASAQFSTQKPVLATLEGDSYGFAMPPQIRDGEITVRVGDARRTIPVEPKMRPALSELLVQIELPDYLERSDPLVEDARGGSVNPVIGSTVLFRATATRDLKEATLDGEPQSVDGAKVTTQPVPVESSAEYSLAWRDGFGLTPREPQVLHVDARDDAPPNVNLNKLKSDQVILSTEALTFEIQARDDFGIKRIGLEWQGIEDPIQNPEPAQGEKIVAAGTPANEAMTVPATFSASREAVRPQSLQLRAFAEDYLPNRDRAYSPFLVLHVLTPTDHFKWLTEQMSQWADAAQEVYDTELQLNEVNRELMALPPETLDDPAERKRIQNQAAAEHANAATLDTLIDIGKDLVQEATKNEEFAAQQLDDWAEMLKLLEEIAGQQMPSVAELLAMAAEAQGVPAEAASTMLPGEHVEQPEPMTQDNPVEETVAAPPGGKAYDLEKAEKYGPDTKLEELQELPDDPNTPGGEVAVDRSKQPEGEPAYIPANPTPLVLDIESGYNKSEQAGSVPQVVGGLGIPVTLLKGSGKEQEDTPASTAELVLQAVTEQQSLLDAFAALTGDLSELLLSFSNSTFVKRLKAASRKQVDLAVAINDLDGFGASNDSTYNQSDRQHLADRQEAEAETIYLIQDDMSAYADRKPSANYARVLGEMQSTVVVSEISSIARTITDNNVGQSAIDAEFWADTLDRWAEQLVDPLPDAPPMAVDLIVLPNLPPAIIVEVLRIIDKEIQLRDETRELDQARDALSDSIYEERSGDLGATQGELMERSWELVDEIRALPNGSELEEDSTKLADVAIVMQEVQDLLTTPITGPKTIAAILEVLEILLETGRLPNAPFVVMAPPTTTPALMLMGLGDDKSRAFIEDRAPAQATGRAGRKLPEEFRQGLDAYLNALEGRAEQ